MAKLTVNLDDPEIGPIIKRLMRSGVSRIINSDELVGHFIYIMAAGHRPPIKCGITSNLKKRHRNLVTQSGRNLRIAFCYPMDSEAQARSAEAMAHKALENYRTIGEWFDISPKKARELVGRCLEYFEGFEPETY